MDILSGFDKFGTHSRIFDLTWTPQVLAGVVTAADPKSRSYPDYVEEEIFAPLSLENSSIGEAQGWHGGFP